MLLGFAAIRGFRFCGPLGGHVCSRRRVRDRLYSIQCMGITINWEVMKLVGFQNSARSDKQMVDSVAIVSGGMDSVTLLHYLVKTEQRRPAVMSFRYGQKHARELVCAKYHAELLGCEPYLVADLEPLRGSSAGRPWWMPGWMCRIWRQSPAIHSRSPTCPTAT